MRFCLYANAKHIFGKNTDSDLGVCMIKFALDFEYTGSVAAKEVAYFSVRGFRRALFYSGGESHANRSSNPRAERSVSIITPFVATLTQSPEKSAPQRADL